MISGTRANSVHAQLYLLEGISRWNSDREKQQFQQTDQSSTVLTYNVKLAGVLDSLSTEILGESLLPDFRIPGKYTGTCTMISCTFLFLHLCNNIYFVGVN